jgi:ABC-type glutathione transport system ATPase component
VTQNVYDIAIRKGRRVLVDLKRFVCPTGRITFLFGESGIGKSLTGKALFGLLDAEDLSATVNGHPYEAYRASEAARRMRAEGFFVFQEPSTHLNPLMTLREQLVEGRPDPSGLPRILHELWQGLENEDIQKLLGVYPKPHRPSGGEKQRILCAMALDRMMNPRESGRTDEALFVFDEPTGSLDNRYRDIVLGLIADGFRLHPCTVLVITHDYSMISIVTREWRDIIDRVSFTELALTKDGQRQREFEPETYTSWLKQLRPVRPNVTDGARASGTGVPATTGMLPMGLTPAILQVQPQLAVFGRNLTITGQDTRTPRALTIAPGTMAYLKAPSGMGKTTLAKMLMGLIEGNRFSATLAGISLSEKTDRAIWERHIWGRKAAMVFQHADEALNPRSRVREVFDGLPGLTASREEVNRRVLDFISGSSNAAFLERYVSSLSGGQKQRLNILRSLLLETPLLILDEPLNGLDFESMRKVLALMEDRLARGQGILLISHNEEVFDAVILAEDRYCLLDDRK